MDRLWYGSDLKIWKKEKLGMKKLFLKLIAAVVMLTAAMSVTAFAAGWTLGQGGNSSRWWYDLGNGQYYGQPGQEVEWQWPDGNQDGVAECYAFDSEGWMYADTTTPDGYTVNENGAWTVNGAVQTMVVAAGYAGTGRQALSDVSATDTEPASDSRILIAYFSKTGNTEEAARAIQNVAGGDLFEITAADAYPQSYQETVDRARTELDSNARPALASGISNMQDYDVILLGYPIWWHTEPMIINTFLESYDLNGKLVIPFCTSGGSDISESIPDLTAIVNGRGARVGTGLTANNVDDAAIRSWLSENGIVF